MWWLLLACGDEPGDGPVDGSPSDTASTTSVTPTPTPTETSTPPTTTDLLGGALWTESILLAAAPGGSVYGLAVAPRPEAVAVAFDMSEPDGSHWVYLGVGDPTAARPIGVAMAVLTPEVSHNPAMTADGDGWVLLLKNDASPAQRAAVEIALDGTVGPLETLRPESTAVGGRADVVWNPLQATLRACWTEQSAQDQIWCASRTEAGWGTPTPIVGAPADRDHSALAVDAVGRRLVTYRERAGALWALPVLIDDVEVARIDDEPDIPDAAALAGGGFTVVGERRGRVFHVSCADPTACDWVGETVGDGEHPQVVALPAGGTAIAMDRPDGVWVAANCGAGWRWSLAAPGANLGVRLVAGAPTIAVDPTNDALIVGFVRDDIAANVAGWSRANLGRLCVEGDSPADTGIDTGSATGRDTGARPPADTGARP